MTRETLFADAYAQAEKWVEQFVTFAELDETPPSGPRFGTMQEQHAMAEAVLRLHDALADAAWLMEFNDGYECGHGASYRDECPESCDAHRKMLAVAEALR
jgi:hypothetical protein